MNRRDFFGCVGRALMAGAVTMIVPEIVTPEPEPEVEDQPWTPEQMEAYLELVRNNKPTFMLAG